MLSFEHGAEFELTGIVNSSSDRLVRISGFTKERPFTFQIQTGVGFNSNPFAFRIPEIPIAVIVSDDSAAATQNSVYVELNLSVEGTSFMHLCKGHLGPNQPIGWPDSPPLSPMQNRGNIAIVSSANPAAGAQIILTVEAQSWLRLKSLIFGLTTDATVTTRRVRVAILFSGVTMQLILSISGQLENITETYTFAEGLVSIIDPEGFAQQMPLPADLLLPPGSIIATSTINFQAGDNFTAMSVVAERFLTA